MVSTASQQCMKPHSDELALEECSLDPIACFSISRPPIILTSTQLNCPVMLLLGLAREGLN